MDGQSTAGFHRFKDLGEMRWQHQALCSRPGLRDLSWFPDDDKNYKDKKRRAAERAAVVKICNACPVNAECREFANRIQASAGVWAGKYRGPVRYNR